MTTTSSENPIFAIWGRAHTSDSPVSEGVLLGLSFAADPEGQTTFTADFEHAEDGSREATFLNLFVDPNLRRQGYARRLFSVMAHVALSRGVERIHGSVESQHVLRAIGSLVDEERISFTEPDPSSPEFRIVELPMSLSQAVLSLELAGTVEEDLEQREHGVVVSINLAGLSPSTFEEPQTLVPPPGILDWQ